VAPVADLGMGREAGGKAGALAGGLAGATVVYPAGAVAVEVATVMAVVATARVVASAVREGGSTMGFRGRNPWAEAPSSSLWPGT